MRNDIKDWLLLSAVEGVGTTRLRNLVDAFGSPKAVFEASTEDLKNIPRMDEKTIQNIRKQRNLKFVEEQINGAEKYNIEILTYQDTNYPENLGNIYDPPSILYVRGKIEEEDKCAIAVVGTRRSTIYGKTITEQIATELATHRITVVSGMARGIDSCAHKGALKAKGRTIAVLGCGVDVVYPPENKKLMQKIIDNGAVISEFPIGTTPNSSNFPGRNRIISGLSLGVLVTEAGSRSGALITVKFATEQGREVFAVPGQINSKVSKGTNSLIKDGAKLVQSAEDILEELKPIIGLMPDQKEKAQQLNLSEDEQKIFDLLTNEPIHVDKLAEKSDLTPQNILGILLSLELKGVVQSLPGKNFIVV